VPKDFEFEKAFQNWQYYPWRAFISGGHCAASLSKEKSSSEIYLACLKTAEIGPGQFSKAHSPTPRNLLSKRSKGFKSFQQTQKLLVLNG
jgi:hypothetical protein